MKKKQYWEILRFETVRFPWALCKLFLAISCVCLPKALPSINCFSIPTVAYKYYQLKVHWIFTSIIFQEQWIGILAQYLKVKKWVCLFKAFSLGGFYICNEIFLTFFNWNTFNGSFCCFYFISKHNSFVFWNWNLSIYGHDGIIVHVCDI